MDSSILNLLAIVDEKVVVGSSDLYSAERRATELLNMYPDNAAAQYLNVVVKRMVNSAYISNPENED